MLHLYKGFDWRIDLFVVSYHSIYIHEEKASRIQTNIRQFNGDTGRRNIELSRIWRHFNRPLTEYPHTLLLLIAVVIYYRLEPLVEQDLFTLSERLSSLPGFSRFVLLCSVPSIYGFWDVQCSSFTYLPLVL